MLRRVDTPGAWTVAPRRPSFRASRGYLEIAAPEKSLDGTWGVDLLTGSDGSRFANLLMDTRIWLIKTVAVGIIGAVVGGYAAGNVAGNVLPRRGRDGHQRP